MKLSFSIDDIAQLLTARAKEVLGGKGTATVRFIYGDSDNGRTNVEQVDVIFDEQSPPETATSDENILARNPADNHPKDEGLQWG